VKNGSQLVQYSLSNILHNTVTIAGVALLAISLTASAHAASENVIHSFTAGNGGWPAGNLIFDDSGNLYGMTITGGQKNGNTCVDGCGIVYELSPGSDGGWSSTICTDLARRTASSRRMAWFAIDLEIFTEPRQRAVRMATGLYSSSRQPRPALGNMRSYILSRMPRLESLLTGTSSSMFLAISTEQLNTIGLTEELYLN